MTRLRYQLKDRALFHASPGFVSDKWLDLSHSQRWLMISKSLIELRASNQHLQTHSVVLMGTHLHLLFSCAVLQENFLLEDLHRNLQNKLNAKDQDVFERPLALEHISSYQQLLNTYRYIYRNPVEAGLSDRVETYPFSTLTELLGRQVNLMRSLDLLHVIQNPMRVLAWLNDSSPRHLHD